MPNFKPKNKKKLVVNKHSITTLDNKHDEKMKEFTKITEEELPNLKKQMSTLKKKLRSRKEICYTYSQMDFKINLAASKTRNIWL